MAIGTLNDVILYQAQFQTGLYETVSQAVNAFNAASAGTIILETAFHRGHFLQEAFFLLGDTLTTRVLSSVADVSDSKLSEGELVSPKVNWRDGPVAGTYDQFKKIGDTPERLAFVLGQQAGAKLAQKMISSVTATLKGLFYTTDSAFGACQYDSHGVGTAGVDNVITYKNLVRAQSIYGDAGNRIAAWLMDGASYFKLAEGALGITLDTVAGIQIAAGSVHTMGKPVIITDSPYLRVEANSLSNDRSLVYGLVPSALRVAISEDMNVEIQTITGKANLITRYQSEGAYTVSVKGAKWSTATVNPTDAALATKTNWTKAATSIKDGPGVLLLAQGNFISTK